MIKFKYMEVEGFASIINESFNWDLLGLNIIQAPNGYGKTTFINALIWCIYGKTLSGSVEPWDHIKTKNYKGTRVILNYEINGTQYQIKRHRGFSGERNSLYYTSGTGSTDRGKLDLQKEIERDLGYSFELFKNSIIFGQKLKRIISETGPNKKKVFDDAFELDYIPKAKKIAEEGLQNYQREKVKQQTKISLLEEKIKGKQSEIYAEENMLANFENSKLEDIKKEKEVIKKLKSNILEIDNKNPNISKEIEKLKTEILKLNKEETNTNELITLEKQLTKLESKLEDLLDTKQNTIDTGRILAESIKNLPELCEYCGRPFDDKHKLEEKKRLTKKAKSNFETLELIKTNILSTKKLIKEQEKNIASALEVTNKITINKNCLNALETIVLKRDSIKQDIEKRKENITNIKSRILINNLENLNLELRALREQLGKETKLLNRIGRDVKTYDWLIKDPLSNSGLKAFIFNQMLDSINDRLEYYSSFTKLQVAFVMDMKSANRNLETFVFKDNQPVPYEDLSGGQQQSVDIVTAFAIHDVVSSTKDCSLLVMDEVFEALDHDNIEIITELIQDKAQNKSLFLITHRTEFNPTNSNIIRIEYDGKHTRVA